MIACLRFPFFPASVEQRDHQTLRNQPLILGGHQWQPVRVYSMSAEAARSGVQIDLSLRQARVLCPQAVFQPPYPSHYNGVAGELLARLHDWTPQVEPRLARPSIVYYIDLETTRLPQAQRLAGEMGSMARSGVQLTPSIGLAVTKFAAYLAAKTAYPGRIRPATQATIAAYPLRRLTLPLTLKQRLLLFGLETLGQLAALPAVAVSEQFGADGARLHRLAQGSDLRPVQPPQVERQEQWQLAFDDPIVDGVVLQAALAQAADLLATRLAQLSSSARELTLTLLLDDRTRTQAHAALSHPANTAHALTQQLHALLDRSAVDCGVVEMHVRLEALARLQPRQLTLFDQSPASAEKLQATLTDLGARYGHQLFARPAALQPQSRLLERRFRLRPDEMDTESIQHVTLLA